MEKWGPKSELGGRPEFGLASQSSDLDHNPATCDATEQACSGRISGALPRDFRSASPAPLTDAPTEVASPNVPNPTARPSAHFRKTLALRTSGSSQPPIERRPPGAQESSPPCELSQEEAAVGRGAEGAHGARRPVAVRLRRLRRRARRRRGPRRRLRLPRERRDPRRGIRAEAPARVRLCRRCRRRHLDTLNPTAAHTRGSLRDYTKATRSWFPWGGRSRGRPSKREGTGGREASPDADGALGQFGVPID